MKSILPILFLLLSFLNCQNSTNSNANQEVFVLEHLVRASQNSNIKSPTLILLHGYGSNEKDMFALAQHIDPSWLVISARAPMTIEENKYQWYDIDRSTGVLIHDSSQAENSRKILLKFIDQVIERYQTDAKRIILGGFSQGAIMSNSVGLTRPDKVKGIACFSGMILEEVKPFKSDPLELKNLKVFIAHGQKDLMLPFSHAEDSNAFFIKSGTKPSVHFDESNHTISNTGFTAFVEWMKGI